MNFKVQGLSAKPFKHLYGKSDEELQTLGIKRYVVDRDHGFPDRIEMRDANIGERMLLLNHMSMDKPSPYQASHAIFIREGAEQRFEAVNEIPLVMTSRMLSLRAFDQEGMIIDAGLATGDEIKTSIQKFFENKAVTHVDAHNAARGCYSGRVVRQC